MDLAIGCFCATRKAVPTHECLLIRPELASVPAFEFALNERLWLVEKFDHPAFLTVRNIIRAPGRLTSISLVYDLTGGTRLSEVLAKAASGGQPITAGATVFRAQGNARRACRAPSPERRSGARRDCARAHRARRRKSAHRRLRARPRHRAAALHDRAVLERAARRSAFVGRRRASRSSRRRRAGRAHGRGDVCRTPAARHRAPRRPRRCADEHLGAAADPQLAAASAAHGSAARVRPRRRSVAGADRGDERGRAATRPRRSRSAAVADVAARTTRGAEAAGASEGDHGCGRKARRARCQSGACADAEARRVAGARCRSARVCAAGHDGCDRTQACERRVHESSCCLRG